MSGLRLERVCVEYDGAPAVTEATVDLPAGEVLAVLGPSGSGKSTLLRAIAGLEPVSSGRVLVDGADLAGVPTHRRGCALLFQDGQLFGHLSVARNVGYALRLRRTPKDRIRSRVAQLLALVGLEGYADRLPATLSGGERQRVALARALAVQPAVLLLDEPLSALDAGLRERLALDLREILHATRTTTVMVTHDQEEAYTVADRLAVMREGRVVQQGPIAEVWQRPSDPETALFLGYARVLRGPAASTLLRAAGLPVAPAVALRRSALNVSEGGPLIGEVVESRGTPVQVRLLARVAGLGEVDAVAPLGSHVAPGDAVRLSVDPGRLAVLPDQGEPQVSLH